MFLRLGRSWHRDPTSCYYPSIALGSQTCTVCNLYVHRIAKVLTVLHWNKKSYQQCGLLEKIDEHVDTMMMTPNEVANFNVCSHLFQLLLLKITRLSCNRSCQLPFKSNQLSDQFHEKGNKPSNKVDHQWLFFLFFFFFSWQIFSFSPQTLRTFWRNEFC